MSRGTCEKYHDTLVQLALDQREVRVVVNLPYAQVCIAGIVTHESVDYWRIDREDSYTFFSEWQIEEIDDRDGVRIWLKGD